MNVLEPWLLAERLAVLPAQMILTNNPTPLCSSSYRSSPKRAVDKYSTHLHQTFNLHQFHAKHIARPLTLDLYLPPGAIDLL